MKKMIGLTLITVFSSIVTKAQNQEIHNAKVVGMYDVGNQQVTVFFDEETFCFRKSTPHSKNLFVYNEFVLLNFDGNKALAEVQKTNLVEVVQVNKNCQQQEPLEDLIINNGTAQKLSEELDILQKGLAGIITIPIVKTTIKEFLNDNQRNEIIFINELKTSLLNKGIVLFDLIKESLSKQGVQTTDINKLAESYKTITTNGKKFDVFIHVPYSENFESKSSFLITKDFRTDQLNKLYGYKLNEQSILNSVELVENTITTNVVITISVANADNHAVYKTLPWQKCRCTRGSRTEGSDGSILISPSTCKTTGTCNGECGRTGLFSGCPSSNCTGC